MNALIRITLLSVGFVPVGLATAEAPLLSALVGAPGCSHVLDLLHRYGGLEGLPVPQGGAVMPSPQGGFVMPVAELGDLCIATVEELPNDPACPPTLIVGVTNHSNRPVCNVNVSVVALLGPIKPCDPTANVCLESIPAGATVEVEIILPPEALAMGADRGAPVGFQRLIVAVDSFDRFLEIDEANNLKLLCRADIPARVVTVEATAVEAAPGEPVETVPPPGVEQPALDEAIEKFSLGVAEADATAQRL